MKLRDLELYDRKVKRLWYDYEIRSLMQKLFKEGRDVVWIEGIPIDYRYYLNELVYRYDKDDKQRKMFEYV